MHLSGRSLTQPVGAEVGNTITSCAWAHLAVINDPAWQRVLIEDMHEALRPGAEGWTDEGLAPLGRYHFDPADVRCSVVWWHGEHDANAPLSAVHRVVEKIPNVDLRVWSAGHLKSYRRLDKILSELLAR
jgi:pimeloyl-ACP methyl ester carboxylesterase